MLHHTGEPRAEVFGRAHVGACGCAISPCRLFVRPFKSRYAATRERLSARQKCYVSHRQLFFSTPAGNCGLSTCLRATPAEPAMSVPACRCSCLSPPCLAPSLKFSRQTRRSVGCHIQAQAPPPVAINRDDDSRRKHSTLSARVLRSVRLCVQMQGALHVC